MANKATPVWAEASRWPTLSDRCLTWSGTCDYCGEEYPADTRINAVLSPTRFLISCRCSPAKWVEMGGVCD